jgi:hypothetical protein
MSILDYITRKKPTMPVSQEHEILRILIKAYPEYVNVWTLINATKSVTVASVVSELRRKLKDMDKSNVLYLNPIINKEEKSINQYGNASKESWYRLNVGCLETAKELNKKYENG